MINRYLRDEHLPSSFVWEHKQPTICQNEDGFLVFDDIILDKNHSRKIESVRWQYSGNAHGIVRGIGLVSCIYINSNTKQFWLIDYRVFDPERDGKSKVDHVQDMLKNVIYSKQLSFKTVLVDTWYASNKFMLYVHDLEKYFRSQGVRNWIFTSKVCNAKEQLINYDLVTAATIPIRRHLKIKSEATPYHSEFIEYFVKREKLGHLMWP